MSRCALIIEVPTAEPLVGAWRTVHDYRANQGIPAHITSLTPFVRTGLHDEGVRSVLGGVLAVTAAFDFELVSVGEFEGTVWLGPEPLTPFVDMQNRLVNAFPEYLPYGGQVNDPKPHLTVGQKMSAADQVAVLHDFESEARPFLPLRCRAEGLSLFVELADESWHREEFFAFGR